MKDGYSMCWNEWALDERIKNELNLLLIISSLCAEKGYCWASNKHLAELFNVSEISISRKIKKLEKLGYIKIEYKKRGCEITNRVLRLTKMLIDDYQKKQSTINKNVKENNISNTNTISINNIICHLNEKTNKHFRTTSTTTRLINTRFKEGFVEEDFFKVIDNKTEEWLNNSKMNEYLRPSTLFGTKFESYLNQKSKVPNWYGKEIKDDELTNEEQEELENMLKGIK